MVDPDTKVPEPGLDPSFSSLSLSVRVPFRIARPSNDTGG